MKKYKRCTHCKKQEANTGICKICQKLPTCEKCDIIMCQNQNHSGKQKNKKDKICTSCKEPMDTLMQNPDVLSILAVYPNILA